MRQNLVYGGSRAAPTSTYAGPRPSVQLDGYQLGNAGLFHSDPVQAVRNLHGPAIVGDNDELRMLLHPAKHLDETADIRIVERRVDFVEQTERTRLVFEHREHQRDGRQRLLAAGQQLNALESLPRRLRDDLDAALERIGFVEQRET